MKEQKNIINNESINILNREKIEIKGAVEVLSSSEKEVFVKMENNYLLLCGDSLTINKLIPEEKLLSINGSIISVCYQEKTSKKSLLKKVFK